MSSDTPQDLIDYLFKLITPTHVGGQSLIALDLDIVDWDQIPDGFYHGVIAKGEPSPEQTAHLWRIVKPGAHVLMIAPDTCPTGHHGACALEDQGFEIRDAILWVREAGKLHYVPKANARERNAGCEAIALRRKGAVIYELIQDVVEDEELVGNIQAALIEAGVDAELVDALLENGIPKALIPKDQKQYFKKKAGSDKYGNFHPCVKPKDVMAKLLRDVPRGATVLDPFMGSGSTGVACLETGHNFIGIEREAEYMEIADTRIRYWDQARAGWVKTEIVSDATPVTEIAAEMDGGIFDLFE